VFTCRKLGGETARVRGAEDRVGAALLDVVLDPDQLGEGLAQLGADGLGLSELVAEGDEAQHGLPFAAGPDEHVPQPALVGVLVVGRPLAALGQAQREAEEADGELGLHPAVVEGHDLMGARLEEAGADARAVRLEGDEHLVAVAPGLGGGEGRQDLDLDARQAGEAVAHDVPLEPLLGLHRELLPVAAPAVGLGAARGVVHRAEGLHPVRARRQELQESAAAEAGLLRDDLDLDLVARGRVGDEGHLVRVRGLAHPHAPGPDPQDAQPLRHEGDSTRYV
jgi:hypothetical protein